MAEARLKSTPTTSSPTTRSNGITTTASLTDAAPIDGDRSTERFGHSDRSAHERPPSARSSSALVIFNHPQMYAACLLVELVARTSSQALPVTSESAATTRRCAHSKTSKRSTLHPSAPAPCSRSTTRSLRRDPLDDLSVDERSLMCSLLPFPLRSLLDAAWRHVDLLSVLCRSSTPRYHRWKRLVEACAVESEHRHEEQKDGHVHRWRRSRPDRHHPADPTVDILVAHSEGSRLSVISFLRESREYPSWRERSRRMTSANASAGAPARGRIRRRAGPAGLCPR